MESQLFNRLYVASKSEAYETVKEYLEYLRDEAMEEIMEAGTEGELRVCQGKLQVYDVLINLEQRTQEIREQTGLVEELNERLEQN